MNVHLQRARFFMDQRRYTEAQNELASALAANPDDSAAHAMLGFALHRSKQSKQGRKEATRAVELDPASSYAHRTVGHICLESGDQKTAQIALREAIRLAPYDANAYGLLALSLGATGKWKDSLELAERGLALNANEPNCANARAQALSFIGGKKDTEAAVQAGLQQNSESSLAQTYAGWAMLRQGNSKGALAHFKEALRLDPNREEARRGLVEALRAQHAVYRILITWTKWMQRLPPRARGGLTVGLYLAFRLSLMVATDDPRSGPYIFPIIGAYVAFAIFTWVAGPVMNIFLLATPIGRMALAKSERIETTVLVVLLASSLAACLAAVMVRSNNPLLAAGLGAGLSILIAMLVRVRSSRLSTSLVCILGYFCVALVWLIILVGILAAKSPSGG